MTVQGLINRLQELGPAHMEDEVLIFDADSGDWQTVTGITFNIKVELLDFPIVKLHAEIET